MSVQALPGMSGPGAPRSVVAAPAPARAGRGRTVRAPAGRRLRQPLPMRLRLGALRLLATAVVCAAVVVGLGMLGAVGQALWAGDPAAHGGAHMVRVQPGESLIELAKRAVPDVAPAVVVRQMAALNDRVLTTVPAGQSVLVPGGS